MCEQDILWISKSHLITPAPSNVELLDCSKKLQDVR